MLQVLGRTGQTGLLAVQPVDSELGRENAFNLARENEKQKMNLAS